MAGSPVKRARRAAQAGHDHDAEIESLLHAHGVVSRAVESAVQQMPWLKPSDLGMVALASQYAGILDGPLTHPDTIAKIGVRLEAALRALGGAPAERAALDTGTVVRGRLAELRSARDGKAKAVDSSAS